MKPKTPKRFSVKHPQLKIKIVCVGGGGCNVANWLIKKSVPGEVICMDTNRQALAKRLSLKRILLPTANESPYTGSGGNQAFGRRAAIRAIEDIERSLVGADIVVLIATLGGGTGGGALPVIAKAARQLGSLTVLVTTTPFEHEGPVRKKNAQEMFEMLKPQVDIWLGLSNEELNTRFDGDSLPDMFAIFDRTCYLVILILRECLEQKGHLEWLRNVGPAVVAWGPSVKYALLQGWPKRDLSQAKKLFGVFRAERGAKGALRFKEHASEIKSLFPNVDHFLGKRVTQTKIDEDYRVLLLATGFENARSS